MTDTILDRVVRALDDALGHDGNVVEPPVALLWPDGGRQWATAIDLMRARRPVVTLGNRDPDRAQGPAYWLRCVVAGTLRLEGTEGIPIVYLPGVTRDDIRTTGATNQVLAPLVPLQHRSQWFTQASGKDWTVRALFANQERGLGLSVAGDDATAGTLPGALPQLFTQPMARLDGRHVDAPFLNNLVNPDLVRLLLQWIDDPKTVENDLDPAAWASFVQQCNTDYGFNPRLDGVLEAARRLGMAEGPWEQVWKRFRESPTDFGGIPRRLQEAKPQELFVGGNPGWPQDNETHEDQLRARLVDLQVLTPAGARGEVAALESDHRARRGTVWADLGQAPLALALEHLAEVARSTATSPQAGSVESIAGWYATTGWRVDRSALRALAEVDRSAEIDVVASALTAIYRPWLEQAATALQEAVGPEANSGTYRATPARIPTAGQVVMFVDGLRLDVAHLLAERLESGASTVELGTAFAALPTVTQTAKPVLVPIDQALLGPGTALDACRASGGASAGAQVLRSLLSDADIQVLGPQDLGDPTGRAWTEAGEIDHKGHDLGVRLAHEIDDQIQRIARRVHDLLDAGWVKVTVLTDHGWLLVPSGLPKSEGLPVAATVAKKGRCARLKDGASVSVATVPWHWDADVRVALAPGISCFEANQTYEHGGVSPQECVVPRLMVTSSTKATPTHAAITSLKWRGLTLVVEFSDLPEGAKVDLRRHTGEAGSSIAEVAKVTGGTGKVILLVGDEDLEGQHAHLVVLASDGALLLRRETLVGQNR